MKVFRNVKNLGQWEHPEAGFKCLVFYSEDSKDWYEVRKDWRGVIAVWPEDDNTIGSFCWNAIDYVPLEGQTLYEVDPDTVPHNNEVMKLLGYYAYDGKEFTRTSLGQNTERTTEEILADLDRLRAELLAKGE